MSICHRLRAEVRKDHRKFDCRLQCIGGFHPPGLAAARCHRYDMVCSDGPNVLQEADRVMRFACRQSRPRPGYTLLEMIILVALLALVAGLSWPSLSKLSQKRELLEAARQVRVALLRTRLEAIETGTARQFSYQPGTGVFESAVFSQMESLATATTASSEASLPTGLQPEPESALGARNEAGNPNQPALPDGVFFVDLQSQNPLDTAPLTGEDDSDAPWSTPILFYPTGRALNARLQLSNGRYTIEVLLRGLTGTARIGQVQRLVELGDEVEGGYQ